MTHNATSYDSSSLTELSAGDAVRLMRQGDFKAETYASALLAQARARKDLNAFITLQEDDVMEAARAADAARSRGAALGILHGLPIPVKDSVNTKALPTSNGTAALRALRPANDAILVQRLLAQGALVMGKTNMTELSFGWTSNNGTFGPVHNPYGFDRIPGGSSGGSAAAVAGRIAPLAIAADTLGSIRVPAAMCGLAGYRPTFGRYPGDGIMALTLDKLDQVGAVARHAADLALFDAAITHEPMASAAPLKGMRIGIAPFFNVGLDSEVERLINEGFRRLQDAGATLVEADVPEAVKSAFDVAATIMLFETVEGITRFLREQQTDVSFDAMFEQVSGQMREFLQSVALPPNRPPVEAYDVMVKQRRHLISELQRYFTEQGISAIAYPAISGLPAPIGEEAEVEIRGEKVSFFVAYGRNTALSPACGGPALVLPVGLSAHGLPVGLEFGSLPGWDKILLSLGIACEERLGVIAAPRIR